MALILYCNKFFILVSCLFLATVQAQKDIRVVALDDAAFDKYGEDEAYSRLVGAIKSVRAGDIIFDIGLWKPIDYSQVQNTFLQAEKEAQYKKLQRIFFTNVEEFCSTAGPEQKFFITTPSKVKNKAQAKYLYYQSLSGIDLEREVPDCVEFVYAKGYEKLIVNNDIVMNQISIVKLKDTDLEHVSFAVNRKIWKSEGTGSSLKDVERELLLDYSLVDHLEYFNENYLPVNQGVAVSSMREDQILEADITIFSGHSVKRDVYVQKIDENGIIKKWYPGYFLIVLGIEQTAQL